MDAHAGASWLEAQASADSLKAQVSAARLCAQRERSVGVYVHYPKARKSPTQLVVILMAGHRSIEFYPCMHACTFSGVLYMLLKHVRRVLSSSYTGTHFKVRGSAWERKCHAVSF